MTQISKSSAFYPLFYSLHCGKSKISIYTSLPNLQSPLLKNPNPHLHLVLKSSNLQDLKLKISKIYCKKWPNLQVGWLVYLVPGHTVPSVLYILYGTITKKCLTCRWSTIQTCWYTYKNRILTNLYKLWKFDMILDRKDCHFFHVCINMKYCKMNTGNKVVTTASLTRKATIIHGFLAQELPPIFLILFMNAEGPL